VADPHAPLYPDSFRYVTWAEEIPLPQLPDEGGWRENDCFDAYDSVTGIGF